MSCHVVTSSCLGNFIAGANASDIYIDKWECSYSLIKSFCLSFTFPCAQFILLRHYCWRWTNTMTATQSFVIVLPIFYGLIHLQNSHVIHLSHLHHLGDVWDIHFLEPTKSHLFWGLLLASTCGQQNLRFQRQDLTLVNELIDTDCPQTSRVVHSDPVK